MAIWQTPFVIEQTQLILENYRHWFGQDLIPRNVSPEQEAKALFEAPFVVFSHGTQADPLYNYGNRIGLELWERDWDSLRQMPSRQSATEIHQTERQGVLQESRSYGYKQNFSAVRVSQSGRQIQIENATLWDLLSPAGEYRGQAATFSQWTFLDKITELL